MTRREEVIVSLLERLAEFTEPLNGPTGIAGDGDSVALMPRTYTPSVREVERLMRRMRVERRSQWWHVNARYVLCEHVARDVPVRRKAKNGKTVTLLERQLVAVFDRGVRAEKVRRGVEWLAAEWALPHEPMLPLEAIAA